MATTAVKVKRQAKVKVKRPHWYMLHVGECPVCGSDKSYRERVYGRKPKDINKQTKHIPDTITYDHCLG